MGRIGPASRLEAILCALPVSFLWNNSSGKKLPTVGSRSLRPRDDNAMAPKVLVVDDSKLARMVMGSAFRRIRPELEVTEAANASLALDVIDNGTIDIALIDFNMPGTDGLELVARIRGTRPQMPIAVVSANIQDEIIARTRELNAAFVAKPLTDEALRAFLSGALLRLKKAAQ